MMKKNILQRGYIALVSALILSAILMILAVGLSARAFSTRFTIIDSELKMQSYGFAESCVQIAVIRVAASIAESSIYTGDANPIPIGDGFCEIVLVTDTGSEFSVQARSIVGEATTNLQARLGFDADGTLIVISSREVASF